MLGTSQVGICARDGRENRKKSRMVTRCSCREARCSAGPVGKWVLHAGRVEYSAAHGPQFGVAEATAGGIMSIAARRHRVLRRGPRGGHLQRGDDGAGEARAHAAERGAELRDRQRLELRAVHLPGESGRQAWTPLCTEWVHRHAIGTCETVND